MIGPLWGETDEAKRIAGWKAVDSYIAENAYVHPAAPVCAADRAREGRQGRAARVGRAAAGADDAGLRSSDSLPRAGTFPNGRRAYFVSECSARRMILQRVPRPSADHGRHAVRRGGGRVRA